MIFALRGARFRAYSQGLHVSMCSPRAVSYDLIRAVRVALRARARHWVKVDYSCLLNNFALNA